MDLNQWKGLEDVLHVLLHAHTTVSPHSPSLFIEKLNTHLVEHGIEIVLRHGFVIDAMCTLDNRDSAAHIIAKTVETLRSETRGYYRAGQPLARVAQG